MNFDSSPAHHQISTKFYDSPSNSFKHISQKSQECQVHGWTTGKGSPKLISSVEQKDV